MATQKIPLLFIRVTFYHIPPVRGETRRRSRRTYESKKTAPFSVVMRSFTG